MKFNEREYQLLENLASAIIPSENNQPGAREAKVVQFIQKLLVRTDIGDQVNEWKNLYQTSLQKLIEHEQIFVHETYEIESFLKNISLGKIQNWPDSTAFFNLFRTHVIYGFLSDPKHGGNADKCGWQFYGNQYFY